MSKIFIIDDEDLVRDLLADQFRDAGHEVVEAASLREAVQKFDLEKTTLDIVVTDFHLLDGTGGQLIDHIRAIDPDMPCIMISGRQEPEQRADRSDPAFKFLGKPFRFPVLSKLAEELIAVRSEKIRSMQAPLQKASSG